MKISRALQSGKILALIAIGGFLGANMRYGISEVVSGPLGTFIVNVTGSFLLGFLVYEAAYTNMLSEHGRVVLTIGFLSSYTTYSTFAFETIELTPLLAIANVSLSYAFGFAGVILGRWFARRLRGVAND